MRRVDCPAGVDAEVDAWTESRGLTQFPMLVLHVGGRQATFEGQRTAKAIGTWVVEMRATMLQAAALPAPSPESRDNSTDAHSADAQSADAHSADAQSADAHSTDAQSA
jgi:hypothetical protein